MIELKCPICQMKLDSDAKSFKCPKGHLFDISKSGYVNLIPNSSSRGHGDDKAMLRARTEFLEKGYYAPLREKLVEIGEKYLPDGGKILDAGCGEGYYSFEIFSSLKSKNCEAALIDVSKDAVEKCAKRFMKNGTFAVASVYSLPFFDESFDLIYSVFSPLAAEEFGRTAKNGAHLVRVIPLENHLYELKKAVYETPYLNEVEEKNIPGFELSESVTLKYRSLIETNSDIKNLFMMTPYSHKTSEKDKEKLDLIEKLDCEMEFGILIYSKK